MKPIDGNANLPRDQRLVGEGKKYSNMPAEDMVNENEFITGMDTKKAKVKN